MAQINNIPAGAIRIEPQAGPQLIFLSSKADIVIYGGAAGGGKTFALLMECARHTKNPQFSAIIFRRTYQQIKNEGGLWDTSVEMYPLLKARPRESDYEWVFPTGSTVRFAHMEHEGDRLNWLGAQIPLICFDELVTFTERQFWYLVSRNRSMSGVRPYMRCTTNPDPDSWVATLISWWIDQETGYPIPERSGVLRWFVRVNDALMWFDTRQEAIQYLLEQGYNPEQYTPKSLTFIAANVFDNQKLLAKDPSYLANLQSLPLVEREQLLGGNWKIRPAAGLVFPVGCFKIVDVAPAEMRRVRYWDKAGTEGAGKYSCGIKMGKTETGLFYVEDVQRGQWGALNREMIIRQTAELDGAEVEFWVEQEPGSGGKESAENTIKNLVGFNIMADRVTGKKVARARPYAAQAQAGNVFLLRAPWNDAYIKEHNNFGPDADLGKLICDQIDASSGAFNKLALGGEMFADLKPAPQPVPPEERAYSFSTEDELRQQQMAQFWQQFRR